MQNQLNITVASLTTNITKPLSTYTVNYLQGLIDELCREDTQLTAEQFFNQFRCVLHACGCLPEARSDAPVIQGSFPIFNKAELTATPPEDGFVFDGGKTLDDAAKHFGIGRTKFIQWLRCEGFLTLDNSPHKEYADMGHFRTARSGKRVIITKSGMGFIKKHIAMNAD